MQKPIKNYVPINPLSPTLIGLDKWTDQINPMFRESIVGPLQLPPDANEMTNIDPELKRFMDAGDAPVYIGWGSVT